MNKKKKNNFKIMNFIKKNIGGVKMNTLSLILVIIVILVVLSLLVFGVSKLISKSSNDEKSPVIAEMSFLSIAEEVQYDGSLILDDGLVYSWSFTGPMYEYDGYELGSKDGLVKYVKKHGTKEGKVVSQEDLRFIVKNSKKIQNDVALGCGDEEIGTKSYYVQTSEGFTLLSSSGQCNGINKDKKTNDVLKTIKKYVD